MSEYIISDQTLNAIQAKVWCAGNNGETHEYAKTTGFEEIIRCKDCANCHERFSEGPYMSAIVLVCGIHVTRLGYERPVRPNNFCCWAIRRNHERN